MFADGKTIEYLTENFNCTKLTIIRNLKRNLGESEYKRLSKRNKNNKKKEIHYFNETKENSYAKKIPNDTSNEVDLLTATSFIEIAPIDYEIENIPRKEFSSIPIKDIEFPQTVYMIVDKKIELIVKLLKDYPDWSFLPIEDLNRLTIEVYFDLKIAKRFCNKEQKIIKIPNSNVFEIAAPVLISRGISRIVSQDKLIAL